MSCINGLRSTWLDGASAGGTHTFIGYHATDPAGTPGAGGTTPVFDTGSDDPTIDTDGYIAGWYFWEYQVGSGACQMTTAYKFPVVQDGDAGTTQTLNMCLGDPPINLYNTIGANVPTTGFQPPSAAWSGTGIADSGYDDNGTSSDPADDLFTPLNVGTLIFTLTVTPQPYTGWPLDDCEECDPKTATLTINITEPLNLGVPTDTAVCN